MPCRLSFSLKVKNKAHQFIHSLTHSFIYSISVPRLSKSLSREKLTTCFEYLLNAMYFSLLYYNIGLIKKSGDVLLQLFFVENTRKQTWVLNSSSLRKKCPYSELLWSVFSRIRTEYKRYGLSLSIQSECGKIRTIIIPNTDTLHSAFVFILLLKYSDPE